MSHRYRAVTWTPQKKRYDVVLVAAILFFLAAFIGLSTVIRPSWTIETRLLRAFGTLALVLLTFILTIGPVARLNPRFLHLLYNRRHLGVATFLVAAAHGVLALVQFHGFGSLNPFVSVLTSDGSFQIFTAVPFQPFGFFALVVLFLMAASSHDFWLANLGPSLWKGLHMLVYVAYAFVMAHVAFGALQDQSSSLLWGGLGLLALGVPVLHLWSTRASPPRRADRSDEGYVEVCGLEDLDIGIGQVVELVDGARRAVFRLDDRVVCVQNECCHQMGPLGEGRILDGCITCPWHGFQYDPVTGVSPPPFTERVETYDVRLRTGRVLVRAQPNRLGAPARFEES